MSHPNSMFPNGWIWLAACYSHGRPAGRDAGWRMGLPVCPHSDHHRWWRQKFPKRSSKAFLRRFEPQINRNQTPYKCYDRSLSRLVQFEHQVWAGIYDIVAFHQGVEPFDAPGHHIIQKRRVTAQVDPLWLPVNHLHPVIFCDWRDKAIVETHWKIIKLHFIIAKVNIAVIQRVIICSIHIDPNAGGLPIGIKKDRQDHVVPPNVRDGSSEPL